MGDPLKDWRRPTTRTRTSPRAGSGISRSASSSGPPARATLLRDQRGVTPTEAGALVLDKAEDLLHLEQAMKDDIGALSGTIAGEVALSAYRRTVHIRQNSDRILFARAHARARYRTGSASLRPGKPPFQPNLDRPGASAAERYNRIDAARLEKTSCLRHAVLRSIPCLSAISTCRPRPIIRTRLCSGGCSRSGARPRPGAYSCSSCGTRISTLGPPQIPK